MWNISTLHNALLAMTVVLTAPTISIAGNYALIVGVDECPRFNGPVRRGPRRLHGAERDAEVIGQMLRDSFGFPAENVKVLTGKNATHANIYAEFKRLAGKLVSGDQFVFHFSGHGTQCPDEAPIDEQQFDKLDEALCPYDAIATDRKTLIVDDQLNKWLGELMSDRITVILDCCHSGTGIKNPGDPWLVRSLPMAQNRPAARQDNDHWSELTRGVKTPNRRVVALYACRSNQRAYEGPHFRKKRKMGLFSRYLVEGLTAGKGRADIDRNNVVSVREIIDYARQKIDTRFNRGRTPAERQEPYYVSARDQWALIEQ